jgi:hypothetical protein
LAYAPQHNRHASSRKVWRMRKSCEQCGNAAEVTVCWLVSTLGVSPRAQKCSKVAALCIQCLNRCCKADAGMMHPILRESLSEAYTAILGPFNANSLNLPQSAEVTQ